MKRFNKQLPLLFHWSSIMGSHTARPGQYSISLAFHSPKDRLAGKNSFYQFPFVHQHETAHQQILNTKACLHGMLIGSAVGYDLGVTSLTPRLSAIFEGRQFGGI
jgi:hypothetical protein